MSLEPTPTPERNEAVQAGEPPFWRRCPLTLGFVLLLTLIYTLSSFPSGFQKPADGFIILGGFYPPLVHQGEWWRYITATLLHANPMHWFNNIAGLLIFGNLLEPLLGAPLLFSLYLGSAVGGLWLSSIMLPKGFTFGASAIDFGLVGAYLTLMLLARLQTNQAAFWKELRGALILSVIFVLWSITESATINFWAHLGGLLTGIGFMLILWLIRKRPAG
ncbi:rhomboid family intramembrane serine protease [Vampirovibrio chlorellavorus]|uniref:rhomboid family intramembrane serine protease n=1 Tax=Vampirovibrio chlorellavorus TaxID=758823 RepID=UPI0026EDBB81|nr:rhomboid family intramembrane serine protease [Vampirovibrio chlorellavorus]